MVRIRPKDTELIKKLGELNKLYFTVADLEKVLGLKRESLYVTLTRLVKSGVLERPKRNIYKLFTREFDIEYIAEELYFPSYLSFESALARYNIFSQIPRAATFATTRPSKNTFIANTRIEYSHIKKDLFFGYLLENGKYIAEKEKALLDQLYMVSRGKRSIAIEELDLKEINREKLEEYVKRFPPYVNKLLPEIKKYIGTTPVTLENKDRIEWEKEQRLKP